MDNDTALLAPYGDLPEPGGAAYLLVDAQGALLSWSRRMQQLLGYSAADLRRLRLSELFDGAATAARLTGSGPPGQADSVTSARMRRKEGTTVEMVLRSHSVLGADGGNYRLIQADTADAARQGDLRRALLRGLFTESPYIIDVFDDQLRFLAQNHSQVRATGFTHRVTGLTMREAAPPGLLDFDALEERQRRVLATGEPMIANEVRGRLPEADRDAVWSETIVPLRSGAGEIFALAHLVLDITEETRARERLALVNDAGARIGSTLDVMQTAQELTDVVVPGFADYAYVNLLDSVLAGREPEPGPVGDAVPLRRAAQSVIPGGPVDTRVTRGERDRFASAPGSLVAQVLASGEPRLLTGEQLFHEFVTADPRRATLTREHGVRSWMLVPMYARGTALGTVVFTRFRQADPFEADDILLAQEFAARAGVCLDNASRYTHERTTALALQHSLLPQRLPALSGLETASRYLPAGGRGTLGGAWFDVIRLSSARAGLVVGDAPGHGLQAAVTMGRLRTAVRTLADMDLPPEELLTEVDEQVKRWQEEQGPGAVGATGTTCLYATFDPISRRCTLASAGHPAPLRITADGEITPLELPHGPPLGVSGIPFASDEVQLADDDLLVLHTRGLDRHDGRQPPDSGHTPLSEVLAAARAAHRPGSGTGLSTLCDTVLRRLFPSLPHRDVALLVTRVHSLDDGRHVTWELASAPESVPRARKLTSGQLADWQLQELDFTTEVVVSELVTNAIRYGKPPITLRLIRDRNLICEVSDGSSTSPHVRRALETDEGGRGLFMVAQLAELWGTRYHARGKSIWAEEPIDTAA